MDGWMDELVDGQKGGWMNGMVISIYLSRK